MKNRNLLTELTLLLAVLLTLGAARAQTDILPRVSIGFAPVDLTMDETAWLNFVNSEPSAGAPFSGSTPVIVRTTQVRGAEGTGSCGGGYGLGVGLVDLDHGLAAGATTYDHNGVLWCETYAPYLWSEQDGMSTLFELQGDYNWMRSIYGAGGMTQDGSKLVGSVVFLDRGNTAPWMWTADGGPVQFLKLPDGYGGGSAVAVSNDGRVIAGNFRSGGRVGVSQAAV